MKNKLKISLFPAVCLIVLFVLAVYGLAYFVPSMAEVRVINQEINNLRSEAQIYEPYLNDHSPLQSQIDGVNEQIEELHKNGYTNDGSVSLIIGEAILDYGVELNSMSIDAPTKIEEYDALPIRLELSGEKDKLLSFIDFFENNEDGAFLVYYADLDASGYKSILKLDMYLCTPEK